MSKELQRYFAAVIGCVIGATWAVAGFGAALTALLASVLGYWVIALAQRRSLESSVHFAVPDLSGIAARARGSIHDARRPRGRRAKPTPSRRSTALATEPVALDAQLADDSLEAAAGQYGW